MWARLTRVWPVKRLSNRPRLWIAVGRIAAIALACSVALRFDVPRTDDRDIVLDRLVSSQHFDLVGWAIGAQINKLGHELTLPQLSMTAGARADLVRDYVRRIEDVRRLEADINGAFADPTRRDASLATRDLREQRDALRAALRARQDTVEAILQEQVEEALREEGFAVGGQVLPPLRFRMTELPHVLIVSRRDRIERIEQRELATDLPVEAQDALEREVDRRLDVSSMVAGIGGMGAYPTMLPETGSLRFIIHTAAHEWLHNYLLFTLAPVAVNYDADPVARAINETTAVIVEREIGARVMARHYPELSASLASDVAASIQAQQAFDFRKEMRETRLRVDELLDQGRIDEAEAYMEERRALFVKNGYLIRKLNQAYFAFYGAYNADPDGAPTAGRDPIGPAVRALRAQSATLGDFIRAIQSVTGLEDLQRRAGAAPG